MKSVRRPRPTESRHLPSSPGGLISINKAGSMVMDEQERHDHADAGDLPQFRHARIGGGQEGEKPAAVAAAGQRQRGNADAAARLLQRQVTNRS